MLSFHIYTFILLFTDKKKKKCLLVNLATGKFSTCDYLGSLYQIILNSFHIDKFFIFNRNSNDII